MTVSVVILNWNGRDFLRKYLPSLLVSVAGMDGVSIVVADNHSTDDSLKVLAKEFPSVKTIALTRNYGFAEGYNRALKRLDSDLFVLLNSDVEVRSDWLFPLVEWMEMHPDCGICGPKLHQMEDRDMFEYAGAAGGFIDRLGYPFCKGRIMDCVETDVGQYDVPADVMWVSGAALMIRSELYFRLGGLKKEFFAHMEEIDLCWRARLQGWKVSMVPRSTVFHVGGGSLPQTSSRKLFFNYRNNLLMLAANLPATLALDTMFALCEHITDEEEGPDMFENCCQTYCMQNRPFQKEICDSAVDFGMKRAGLIIFKRKCYDLLSAAVYLLKGHMDYARAVIQAHKEYKAMSRMPHKAELSKYLDRIMSGEDMDIARNLMFHTEDDCINFGSSSFYIKGIWKSSILWQKLAHRGTDIFDQTKDLI